MRRWGIIGVALASAVGIASAEYAATTGGQTLQRIVAARPAGLAEAFTAVSGDIDAMPINPAGVAKVPSAAVNSSYERGFADQSFGSLAFALPVSFGSFFVGGGYFDAGTIEINQSDGTQDTRRAQQDMVGLAGFALGRETPFSIGVTGKFLRSELAETATASVGAADAGVQWTTPLIGLTLGAAVQNMGPDIKFEQEGDPLPLTYRAGFSYDLDLVKMGILKRFPYHFLVVGDGLKPKDADAGVAAGLELSCDLTFADTEGSAALRGGYRSDNRTFDVGIGFVIGSLTADYALGLITDLDPMHRFTLGYRFSPPNKI